MLEEPSRLRRDLPLIGIGQGTPCVNITADFIDDRSRIVLLLLGRKPLAFVEHKSRLCSHLMLLRFRDRSDEFGTAAALDDLLRGLPSLIKLPVPDRVIVWRVQNWVVEEGVGHSQNL